MSLAAAPDRLDRPPPREDRCVCAGYSAMWAGTATPPRSCCGVCSGSSTAATTPGASRWRARATWRSTSASARSVRQYRRCRAAASASGTRAGRPTAVSPNATRTPISTAAAASPSSTTESCRTTASSGIGWGEDGHFLASDQGALLAHTRRVTFVEDGQAALVTGEGHRLFDVATGQELVPAVTELAGGTGMGDRAGHTDFMTKEIHEQPEVLRRLARDGADAARHLAARIRAARETFAIGCGTAGYAALSAQYLLAGIARRRVTAVAASEFGHLQQFLDKGSLVLAFSQSGETIDVIEAART